LIEAEKGREFSLGVYLSQFASKRAGKLTMKLYSFLEWRKATAKAKTALDATLIGDVETERVAELRSDIKALVEVPSGY